MGLELGLCFSTLVPVEKMGSGSKSSLQIMLFIVQFEMRQTGPKGVWNLTSAFPLWSMLEKVVSHFKPFLKSVWWFSFWKGSSWSQRGLEPDLCFSTSVHVKKRGVRFKTLLKSFYSFSFWKGQTRPKWVWKMASAFPLWPMLEKVGLNSKRFLKWFWSFSFWNGSNQSQRIWNLTSAFPLWSRLEKWGQVPNPFKNTLVFFTVKGAKLVPNGFGTWPLLSKKDQRGKADPHWPAMYQP